MKSNPHKYNEYFSYYIGKKSEHFTKREYTGKTDKVELTMVWEPVGLTIKKLPIEGERVGTYDVKAKEESNHQLLWAIELAHKAYYEDILAFVRSDKIKGHAMRFGNGQLHWDELAPCKEGEYALAQLRRYVKS